MPSGFFPLKILFKINLQAAIVAGIESGWVNPVINKEYAMEEVVDHYHIVTNPSENQHFAAQIFFWPQYFAGPAGALRYHPLQGCQGQACPQGGSRWIERRDGWIFHHHWKVVGWKKRKYAALHNLFFVIIPPCKDQPTVTLKITLGWHCGDVNLVHY